MKLDSRRVIGYLAIWTALAIVFALQSLLYDLQAQRPFRPAVAVFSSMLYWHLWSALGLLVLYLASRFPIAGAGARRHAALHVMFGPIVAAGHVFLRATAERLFNPGSRDGWNTFFVEQFHLDLLVYWGIVGVTHAIAFHRQAVAGAGEAAALRSRAANLEAAIAVARLNALRAQLEPHFLFNTLQAVSTLMREDVRLADRTLGQLSALLRRIVDAADVQEVPLSDELELAQAYLEIQSIRFQTHLTVETYIEPGIERALVPILLIQPLLENACMHGISRRPKGGRVILRGARGGNGIGMLRLSVSNDGPESSASESPEAGIRPREGVGLSNTRKRLTAIYGESGSLEVRTQGTGLTETVVEVPLRWHVVETRSSASPDTRVV